METLSLVFVFVLYIWVRLLLGHHLTPTIKDRRRYAVGIKLVDDHQHEEGLKYFNRILSHRQDSGVAWAYRSICHLYKENFYQALADSNKALDIDYTLRECYLVKGKAFLALEDYEQAHTEFSKAVWHYREKNPETFRYRALAHYYLNQISEAEQDLKRAQNLGDEEANLLLLQIRKTSNVDK